jgi:thiol-disulfide isomerase/thioredoxin
MRSLRYYPTAHIAATNTNDRDPDGTTVLFHIMIRLRAAPTLSRLAALALLLALTNSAFPTPTQEVPIGGILQEATLQGLNGPSRPLSTFRGKPLIINVWASWCGPCRKEMASLERLAWLKRTPYFAIIGISTDDYPDKANGLLRGANATISHYIDVGLTMEHMLGASKLPLTVLVAADGQVLAKVYGARQWDQADELRFIDETFRRKIPRR